MDVANNEIVSSFIHLTNHFATHYDPACDEISTLTDLWEKHGTMMANFTGCDVQTFPSSAKFYEVLYRRIRLVNAEMATALDPKKAEENDIFEICKFYALFLEYLRKDWSPMLTKVLEKLATQTGFHSSLILEMFAFFDKLYGEDSADNWWSCLQGAEDTSFIDTLGTPKRNNITSAFATPTATARRLRTAASSARRSPIAEAVDSPTMKFLRSERELRQLKTKLYDMQQMLEGYDDTNAKLINTNRELKLLVDELKGNAAGNRDTAQNAEKYAEELSASLEARQKEVATLSQQLEESRNLIRTKHRHIEEMEVEKDSLTAKLESASNDRDICMKQLRDLRNANEQEFSSWRQKEQTLIEQLRNTETEQAVLSEQLVAVEDMKDGLLAENQRLTRAMEDLSIVSSRKAQEADNAQTALKQFREEHQHQIQKILEDRDERMKMSDATIARLQKELDDERADKKSLRTLLNDLNDKALKDDKESHEQKEGYLSVRACLEGAKQQIERLQMEVESKEAANAINREQMARMKAAMDTEEVLRNQLKAQFDTKFSLLNDEVTKKSKVVEQLTDELKLVKETYEKNITEKNAEIERKDAVIENINTENEQLKTRSNELKQENYQQAAALKLLESREDAMEVMTVSTDSLCDALEQENQSDTEQEMMQMIAATPRKSVAFSVDMSGDMTSKANPRGFRSDTNNPRQSICSINEDTFDRNSMARSSIRSDTLTLASAHPSSEFKTPFTPSGTSKDRVNVLTARNEKVKPHLQCSYASEMGLVNSPSADEDNVKKGATFKTKTSRRRDSLASVFSFRKTDKN